MALTINHQTNDISATSGSVTIDGAAAGGGGGALEFISKTTLSSTSVVEYTGLDAWKADIKAIKDANPKP